MFGDSVMWGILGGIISIVYNGWFFVIYYTMLLCVYHLWIDKNVIDAPSFNRILKYACLGILVVVVIVECFMWFCLYNPDYTRGMFPDIRNLWESDRIDYEAMIPYAEFNSFVITWIFSFFISFIVAFFIIKFAFFIHRKLRKNSDEILCNFHKGKAIAFGIFAFITTLPLMYLASNFEPLREVGRYLFRFLF